MSDMNNRVSMTQTYTGMTAVVKARLLSFINRLNLHSALAGAGMLAPLMLAIGDLTAGLSTPGYSIVHNSISSLALTRIGWLQTIGFLALGLLVEVFTAGLLFNIKRFRGFHLSIGILVVFGFAVLLIGALRNDPNWKVLLRYTAVTFILAVIFIVALRIMQEQHNWFGLVERLLVLNMMVWVEVAAIRLFMLSLNRRPGK
jgi:hypothetical protein